MHARSNTPFGAVDVALAVVALYARLAADIIANSKVQLIIVAY